MCGLFGWQWRKRPRTLARNIVASVLASAMDTRGGDSWGWYAPEKSVLTKGLGTLSSLPVASFANHRSLIGHTRTATTGDVSADNAHPFKLRSIVGAHNGIVRNHAALNAKYGRVHAVDSMHLFSHIEDDCDLTECEAYGALAWCEINGAPGNIHGSGPEINLARFNNGEMTVAHVPGHGIVWASTDTAVESALSLAGLDYEMYAVRQGVVYTVEDGRLFESERRINCTDPWKRKEFKGWDKVSGANTTTDPWNDGDLNDLSDDDFSDIASSVYWTEDEWTEFDRKITRGEV